MAGKTTTQGRSAAATVSLGLLGLVLLSSTVRLGLNLLAVFTHPGGTMDCWLAWENLKQAGPAVPPGVEFGGVQGVRELTTPPQSLGMRLFAEGGELLHELAWLFGGVYAWRLLSAIERGEPFAHRNAGRLTRIAALVLLGGAGGFWLN